MEAIYKGETYKVKKGYKYITVLFRNTIIELSNRLTVDVMIVRNENLILKKGATNDIK